MGRGSNAFVHQLRRQNDFRACEIEDMKLSLEVVLFKLMESL
jgi:hypothetical protein